MWQSQRRCRWWSRLFDSVRYHALVKGETKRIERKGIISFLVHCFQQNLCPSSALATIAPYKAGSLVSIITLYVF